MADAACMVDEYLTNISASVSETTSIRIPNPRRLVSLAFAYLHYHFVLFRIRKLCKISLSCLSSFEAKVEGKAGVIGDLQRDFEAANPAALADFFRKIDSFAAQYHGIRLYHQLAVQRLQRQIYEMLDDLTTLLDSYAGEDGDPVSVDELLAKMG